jgi:histidyl-tRNA synthetase
MEDISRLTAGQGGENEKLVFQVLKRGEELERALAEGSELADLGLRFDLTVPLTRFFASNHAKLPRVLKAIQIGPVFRAERPQKGRYRQFLQCDIDILGEASELAELELVSAALAALASVGIYDATVRVNDRRVLAAELSALGISNQEQAMIAIDKLDKIAIEGVQEELKQHYGAELAIKVANWIQDSNSSALPAELSWVKNLPDASQVRFDKTLVRGMGYYTGAIFEIEHPGSASAIGGGGRYDNMVGKWSGTDTPAVGLSLGIERILDLLPSEEVGINSLVLLIEENFQAALAVQEELIEQGWSVRLERAAKNTKAQLAELHEQGFGNFAILRSGEKLDIRKLG